MPDIHVKTELWNKLPSDTWKEFEDHVNKALKGKHHVHVVPEGAEPRSDLPPDPGILACMLNCEASMNPCLADCIARGAGLPKSCIYTCAETVADCMRGCNRVGAK